MKYRIDLHVHSKYSGDNDAEPEELIDQAIRLNLYGIAFTEHYSYEASAFVELLREKYGDRIRLLRGVELSAIEGHCLVFGIDTDRLSLKDASITEVVKAVNRSGGVVIPSHPYRKGNSLGDIVQQVWGFCALEGYNGANMQAYNEKAIATARLLDLRYTGGSDAHAPKEVGLCVTEFDDAITYDNFTEILKRGHYQGIDCRRKK